MTGAYLDRFTGSVVADLGKAPCDAATTIPITLAGYQTIDGVNLNQDGLRCLVKNQSDATQNGIYVVLSTTWLRAGDFNGPSGTVCGQLIGVTGGTQAGLWQLTTANPVQIDQSGGQPTAASNINFTNFLLNTNSAGVNIGFANMVVPPLAAPDLPGNLNISLPAGRAVINNLPIAAPAYAATLPANSLVELYLNASGAATPYTVVVTPITNYTAAIRHPDLLKVWSIQTDGSKVVGTSMVARTKPAPIITDDIARTADQVAELYQVTNTPTAWSAGLSVTYGQVLRNSLGYLYQVFTLAGGVTGSSQPTGNPTGLFTDGTVQIGYYGQAGYGNNFRYSLNGGMQSYFTNVMAVNVVDLQGPSSGTQISTIVKSYIINQFKHLVTNRQNSAAYTFQQKVIAGGYIWECRTLAGGTTAGSSPFSGSYTPGTSTVTDGTVSWKCLYTAYSTQEYYWMRHTDSSMLNYQPADAHDSDASTFFDVLWQYIKVTWDWQWLTGNSPVPNKTYLQLLQSLYDKNMATVENALTQTFQGDINPYDGTNFPYQYTEDNIESYTGYVAASNIFTLLEDATRTAEAIYGAALINSGLFGLIDAVKNVSGWFYGDDLTWFGNITLQWYPWYQQLLFWELHQVPAADEVFKLGVRRYIMQHWNNWVDDPGLTAGLPNIMFAFIAARYWQDTDKAHAMVDLVERTFLQNGLIASDFGYYLQTKKLLIDNNRLKNVNGVKVAFEDAARNVFITNNTRLPPIASTINTFFGDNWVGVDTSSAAAALNLPVRTTLPDSYKMTIKDVTGNANTHNITLTPDGGNIDQAGTLVISTASGKATVRYNKSKNQWYSE